MDDEALYTKEYEAIGHAWNIIQDCKAGLPKEVYDRITKILIDLDQVILALHPPHTFAASVLFNPSCDHCTGPRRGL